MHLIKEISKLILIFAALVGSGQILIYLIIVTPIYIFRWWHWGMTFTIDEFLFLLLLLVLLLLAGRWQRKQNERDKGDWL